ncbi:outer membrane lipoprotein [Ramlibacter sp. PS4R-6]|uniref:glycine zipper 2TM domain-containing protein n=1 Tax=Ramlibacter sp. PS4R-6 TaxID=3133438 RepID=UPI0030A0E53B
MKYRLAPVAGGVALVALVSACTTSPRVEVNVPAQPAPVYSTNTVTTVPVSAEYGRIVNIEYFAGGVSRSGPNVPGAIIGAVAGAVVGNQIGGGSGRDAATVLGGVAGAAVGSQVGRTTTVSEALYRVTVQTDTGIVRYYDVPATGDLRVGDRVRIDSGVIYRG